VVVIYTFFRVLGNEKCRKEEMEKWVAASTNLHSEEMIGLMITKKFSPLSSRRLTKVFKKFRMNFIT